MTMISSLKFMLIGGLLLLVGVAVPFSMILRMVEPSFLLLFLSYAASVGGLLLGVLGAMLYVRERQS